MIRDALHVPSCSSHSESKANAARSKSDLFLRLKNQFVAETIDRVVKEENLPRKFGIGSRKRTIGISQHPKHAIGHHAECWRHWVRQMLMSNNLFCNVDSAISDAFQFVVDLDQCQDLADCMLVGLPHGQQRNRRSLDCNIDAVDFVVERNNRPRFCFIVIEVRLDRESHKRQDAISLGMQDSLQFIQLRRKGRHASSISPCQN